MGPKPVGPQSNDMFRQRLDELVNLQHPLARLAQHIDWQVFEEKWTGHFPSSRGRPATSPRLIAGLLYLQHTFALSDEDVVWGWVENPYWQLFCGETWFQHRPPIDPSSLTRWRKRIGEEGLEWMLTQTIKAAESTRVVGLTLRQNDKRAAPRLAVQVGRYAHAKQFKRMRGSLKKLKTIVGRVWRDVERQLDQAPEALKQRDKNKLYSLHAPEAECIAKGKARQPYEFGVKVSIATTHKEGLVVGMRTMPGNPYDGHTLLETLEQVAILTDCQPKEVFVDLGYRGAELPPGTKAYHHKLKRDITQRLRRDIRRRSAIEPAIGHMNNDGRLRRNWLKGADGDAFHALLCGCGHNLRMILRKLRLLFGLNMGWPIWTPLLQLALRRFLGWTEATLSDAPSSPGVHWPLGASGI